HYVKRVFAELVDAFVAWWPEAVESRGEAVDFVFAQALHRGRTSEELPLGEERVASGQVFSILHDAGRDSHCLAPVHDLVAVERPGPVFDDAVEVGLVREPLAVRVETGIGGEFGPLHGFAEPAE